MHNIKANFDKILLVLKDILNAEINEKGNNVRRGSVPRFSDIEVMAMSLTAECLSIDSENLLFPKLRKEYPDDFTNMISRRQYNDRRKLLFEKTEQARRLLATMRNKQADVFAIDSIPWKYVNNQEKKETKWAKNQRCTARIKVTVLHRKSTFMVTN